MTYRVLTDDDVASLLNMHDVVGKIEAVFREKAEGTLVAPPRFSVSTEKGSLVFTAGAATKIERVIGFRVYDTFPGKAPEAAQLVAVFDSENGAFKGIVIGRLIGALRTGAIGGVAVQYMGRPDASVVGILGTGFQARTQLEAAASVRRFDRIRVFSPTLEHRKAFAEEMGTRLGIEVQAVPSPKQAVEDADLLICATTSSTPVFDPDWLKPGVHINTVGAKFKDGHEIDLEVAARSAVIATDSMAQAAAYPRPFFLLDSPHMDRMIELSDIVAGKQAGRNSPDDVTLFCSVGLAGTEVVVANEAIRRMEEVG